MKKWTILVLAMVLLISVVGYIRCFCQTVCVVNSRLEIEGQKFVVDRKEFGRLVRKYQAKKAVRQVNLYRFEEQAGWYKKVKVGNRPLKLERMPGRNGIQILEIQGKEPGLAAVTSLPT